jgi:hypothetical protein
MKNRIIIRSALVALYVGLGALLFILFRGHTVLADNHDAEHAAPDLITVSIDKGDGLAFFRGDRDRFAVTGGNHSITIEFSDGTPPFEGRFRLPIKDDTYILSIPRLLNGVEPFVEVFHATYERHREEELFEGLHNEIGIEGEIGIGIE